MSQEITLKLSNRQANLLLQAALFSCTSDITVDWSNDDLRELVEISKLLETEIEDIELDNVQAYTYRDGSTDSRLVFEDEWTHDILKHFKNGIKIVDVSEQLNNA